MQIVVKQISGLGNQLFQYVAGLYFAKRYGAEMRMAVEPVEKAQSHGFPRPFLLSHFSITSPVRELNLFDRLILSPKAVFRSLRRAMGAQVFTEQFEKRFRFLEDVPLHQGTKTLYLSGYWQNYRMAEQVEDRARAEFGFREPARGKTLEVLEQIRRCKHPVSLHVRRGDYTLAAEGQIALSMDYYTRAMLLFKERRGNPTFFVFSDDVPFVRENLPLEANVVFVEHNDSAHSHEDLRLMASCHDHIIANSTFSWWGAWMNPRPEKVVVAPKHWHLTVDSYFPELLPPGWIVLDTARYSD
jgi:hypothetical protein